MDSCLGMAKMVIESYLMVSTNGPKSHSYGDTSGNTHKMVIPSGFQTVQVKKADEIC